MRLTYHQHTSLADTDTHGITVNGAQDERFTMTVLEHDIVRVQHWPDGAPRLNRTWLVVDDSGDTPREGRPRDDLSPFSLPKFDLTTDGDTLRVKTEAIGEIEIDTAQFRLKWSTAGGDVFLEDVPMRGYAYDRGGRAVFHTVQWNDNDHFYGFGEVTGPLNKARRRIEMRNMDVLNYNAETTTPIYKHFPFYITYNPQLNLAYGLFYDNLASTVFDMGNELDAIWGQFRYYRAEDGDIDYYLLYGPTIAEVVEKFTRLTGRPHMPPKWSLGYLGSTMKYTESENAQEELKEFVDQCKQYDIPCDMFHLSSAYTTH